MFKIKKYVLAIMMMFIVSMISIAILATFTYLFKWQADKATIGIIVTYALAVLSGGAVLWKIEKVTKIKLFVEILLTSTFFVLLLRALSLVVKP